jgi:hypothetical protein
MRKRIKRRKSGKKIGEKIRSETCPRKNEDEKKESKAKNEDERKEE